MAISNPVLQPSTMINIADYYKRIDQNGNIIPIAEALAESNEIMEDVVFKEGSLTNGDQQSIRTGLPEVYWKQYNRGVPSSKSTVATVQETVGMLEAQSKVDSTLIDQNGQGAEFRRTEEIPFIESIAQTFSRTLFKGDARVKSEGFSGFETRYSTLDTAKAENAKNVIDCGGTGNNLTSIWIIGWGDNVYCPYPKGSTAGLKSQDMGIQLVDDEDGNKYRAYVSIYNLTAGLMVRDWRYVVRLANIDVKQLRNGTGIGDGTEGAINLIDKLLEGLTLLPKTKQGKMKLGIYMNRDVYTGLTTLSRRQNSNVVTWQQANNAFGTEGAWATFQGIPLRQVDELTNDEKQVK